MLIYTNSSSNINTTSLSQDNTWSFATATIWDIYSPGKFHFTGTRGDSYEGDVAIDDIAFSECPSVKTLCTEEEFGCDKYPQCVHAEQVSEQGSV